MSLQPSRFGREIPARKSEPSIKKTLSLPVILVSTLLATILIMISSCHKDNTPAQTGVASWYGHPFDGRLTANGEIFDMTKMTAAHRTFPFGTVLSVENVSNGKRTEVRVNDRGPFVQGRIIDLSYAAAQSISMAGIADVRLRIVSTPARRAADSFAVQSGPYSQKSDAKNARSLLARKFSEATLIYREQEQTWFVLVGRQPDLKTADALAEQVGREVKEPVFVVLLDE